MNPNSSASETEETRPSATIITGKASKAVAHHLQPAEQAPSDGETAPSAAQPSQFIVPPLHIPAAPQSQPQSTPATTQATAVVPPVTDLDVVDDGDLIEKEWVNKAKEIVAMTRDDPYKQSEELTVFKADYMKKRYDKHIKLSK